MRKTKPTRKKSAPSSKQKVDTTIDQAMRFIEDMRLLSAGIDEPSRMISLRVPANVLRAFQTKARSHGKKYQSALVQLMREWAQKP